jgi:hypothetical protein
MAQEQDHIRRTLEDFRQQLSAKMNEAARVLAVVNALEDQLGLPKTSPNSAGGLTWNVALGDEARSNDGDHGPTTSAVTTIRPDEYLGDQPLEAAKKYLRRLRRAATLEDIAGAISRGGAAIRSGTDWRTELDASLTRSTREVVKVREGTFGLVEFYTEEQLKGLRAVRRQRPEPVRKQRPRTRSRPKRRRPKANPEVDDES